MFWELTIAFSNPSCPTLKFWFWLTSNFLKTRFYQKAHFKGPWKAPKKQGFSEWRIEKSIADFTRASFWECWSWRKKCPTSTFWPGSPPILSKSFFWKNWYYASLESAKHVLSEYAIKCYFAGFTRASFRENWMWIKKVPNPNFLQWLTSNFLKTPFFKKLILCITGER